MAPRSDAKAQSVQDISVPGVERIEVFSNLGCHYERPPEYIRRNGGDAEVAVSTRCVYDMDSEDEEWLDRQNTEKLDTKSITNVDEDMFENVIDMLEKTCFIDHRDGMPAKVAAEVCQGLGSQDAIEAIHSYWSEKRLRKGMSLVPYFQPTPSERYKKQVNEWKKKTDQIQQESPRPTTRQLKRKRQLENPELFAEPPLLPFCRGPYPLPKIQKQQFHRERELRSSSSRSQHRALDLAESSNAMADKGFTSTGAAGRQPISERTSFFYRRKSGSVRQFENSPTQGSSQPERMKFCTKRTSKIEQIDTEESRPKMAQDLSKRGRKKRCTKRTTRKIEQIVAEESRPKLKPVTLAEESKPKMELIVVIEESRPNRPLGEEQGILNGRLMEMGQRLSSLSNLNPFPPNIDSSTVGVSIASHIIGDSDEDQVTLALAAKALAKVKREIATSLRSRADKLRQTADVAERKAFAALAGARALNEERANEEAVGTDDDECIGNCRQQGDDVPASVSKDDVNRLEAVDEASLFYILRLAWQTLINITKISEMMSNLNLR